MIEPPAYFADSTNSVVEHEGSFYQPEYLLALLNSTLFQWRFKITSSNNNVGTNELDSMPFRTIEFSDPADVGRHSRIVELVGQRVALHERLAAARIGQEITSVQRQISAADRRIDRLVYELYELTEEEIEVVEGG